MMSYDPLGLQIHANKHFHFEHQQHQQSQHHHHHLHHNNNNNLTMPPGKQPETFLYSPASADESMAIMSDEELSNLNIKDLNRKLKEKGLSKQIIEKLKQRRRTLKNRKYATDCREKKDVEVHNLEGAKDEETHDWHNFDQENAALREEIEKMKGLYLRVVDFAKKNKIKLRERNVPISRAS